MTDKKLKVNSAAYTELSIQIAVLQASVDKLLELTMQPKYNPKDHERGPELARNKKKESATIHVDFHEITNCEDAYK